MYKFLLLLVPFSSFSQQYRSLIEKESIPVMTKAAGWYEWLHQHPELSREEKNTAAFLKNEMQQAGYSIVDSLGYHGFAAVLRNGNGPVVLYRTDMDGLPVKEETELPFASKVTADRGGEQVSVMHACGHDIHMSTWLGMAHLMMQLRKQWSGTLIFLAQSAEETGQGARKILASPAFQQLPVAEYQLAIHDHAGLPAGVAGFCDGYSMASVDMLNIIIYGKGGHGAAPQQTIDPVLLAAQYITAIQAVVSRNLSSNDPAVITVGAIHGGTAGNIIPDQVELRLTIRSFSAATRQLIFDRLKTIGNNLAAAAGLPESKWPKYDLLDMSIKSVYNDPALGEKLRGLLKKEWGDSSFTTVKPIMIGEDFGEYGQTDKTIPSYILWIGTVSPDKTGGTDLPSLHTSRFAPDYRRTVPAAIRTMSSCLLLLLNRGK